MKNVLSLKSVKSVKDSASREIVVLRRWVQCHIIDFSLIVKGTDIDFELQLGKTFHECDNLMPLNLFAKDVKNAILNGVDPHVSLKEVFSLNVDGVIALSDSVGQD